MTWTGLLTLTGSMGAQTLHGHKRDGFAVAQIDAIGLNGERVRMTGDGYVAPARKGTLIRVQ